jgi:Divergent InlB B-repeat domain
VRLYGRTDVSTSARVNFAATIISASVIAVTANLAFGSPPDPPKDLLPGVFPAPCYERPGTPGPTSPECENATIYYLDRARGEMGLPPYDLPANFTALSPDRQMFILTNLDRIAYSAPPVPGLNTALDIAAEEGMKAERDPMPAQQAPWLPFYGADWAAFPNALWGYYIWMYSDESVGWGHRHVVFYQGFANIGMGASAGASGNGRESSALIIQSASGEAPYYYTWPEAVAAGAGSNAYDPGVPKFTVTITFAGSGAGTVTGSLTCQATCSQPVALGGRISLRATPARNSSFAGWSGACSGLGVCELTGNANEVVTATFGRVAASNHFSPPAVPTIKLLHARISSRARKARFTFMAMGNVVGFQCALTRRPARHRKQGSTRFVACASPKTYAKLSRAAYVFAVRAITQWGLASRPVERRFEIK